MRNDIYLAGNNYYRVLAETEDRLLVIDCLSQQMPVWVSADFTKSKTTVSESELQDKFGMSYATYDSLSPEDRKTVRERYTIIAPILSSLSDDRMRASMISLAAENSGLSKQTVRKYLCLFLATQHMESLAPAHRSSAKKLSRDEKNFRWALNKYYYSPKKHKLTTVYTLMLKNKYTDETGKLLPDYPPFHRLKYFFYKTRKLQTELISRNGLSHYQRNNRPLLGTVQDYAPSVGYGMMDSTVCDIYLVNSAGQLVGRPILTICVDAFSSLICGYYLSWEGGVFSLQELMKNVIADKKAWCERFGIVISVDEWPCSVLPGVLITDRGPEYIGRTFEQITELGVKLENLPAYRPELKGIVEQSFHGVQELYKPHLLGKGVIQPDYQERGAHDYRKDACLTMDDFEKIIIHCIVHYNSKRILEGFPYTTEMTEAQVAPYASSIWRWNSEQAGANLISVTQEQLRLILLPRTMGRFSRRGFLVNGQRYRHVEGSFAERYLSGDSAVVAYDPDKAGTVWLVEKGLYTPFELISAADRDTSFSELEQLQEAQKQIKRSETDRCTQAKVDLAAHIEAISREARAPEHISIKEIRKTHAIEKAKRKTEAHNG